MSGNPSTLDEFTGLKAADLDRCDVAELNLLTAQGLPGAEDLDIDRLLARLDEIAVDVRRIIFLKENYSQFLSQPENFYRSQPYFCVVCMISVLKTKYGIDYDPKWEHVTPTSEVPDDFGKDARDQFIHAIVDGLGGTCGSLPVFFVAVGRRLGFPLKLVKAMRHLYMRWDDPEGHWLPPDGIPIEYGGEVFNIEASGPDVHRVPDEEYRAEWPFPIPDDYLKADIYLKSLTPREELSEFLAMRANCLRRNGRLRDAIEVYTAACRLAPHNIVRKTIWQRLVDQWQEREWHSVPIAMVTSSDRVVPVRIKWPQWVNVSGQRMLVQLPQSNKTLVGTPADVGLSVMQQHLSLPNGPNGTFLVPTHSAAMPFEAHWVRLSGGEYALVHRRPEKTPHVDNCFSSGQPVLPEKAATASGQSASSGLSSAESSELKLAIERIVKHVDERLSAPNAPKIVRAPVARFIPGRPTPLLRSRD